jgi:hypothetical protein
MTMPRVTMGWDVELDVLHLERGGLLGRIEIFRSQVTFQSFLLLWLLPEAGGGMGEGEG